MKRAEEREAKFDLPGDGSLPDLDRVGPGMSAVRLPPLELVATYYDTVDLRLLRRELTLRHRRAAGEDGAGAGEEAGDGQWTLKLPGGAGKATFTRTELSWPGRADGPPDELAGLVRAVALGAALEPVAEIRTHRRRTELRDAGGARLAEVDDDTVTATPVGPAPIHFRQVEVELDAGDDALLARLARRLKDAGAVRGADEPKLRRALAARLEAKASGDASGTAVTTASSSAAATALTAINGGLEQLLRHDIGLRLDDDPEWVHQARVATRRLRADLHTFGGPLDPGWTQRTRDELKWLATALGRVRDADVLALRLAEHADRADAADRGAFSDLVALQAETRAQAGRDLAAVLGGGRYLQLLRNLHNAAAAPPLADASDSTGATRDPGPGPTAGRGPTTGPDPAEEVTALVAHRWQKLRKAVDRLAAVPSNEELHAIRIRAKQVRYAADAAAPLVGGPARTFAEDLAALQTVLGDHHDSVVAETWYRDAAVGATASAAYAAGQCVTAERRRQAAERRRWEKTWSRLSRRHPRPW